MMLPFLATVGPPEVWVAIISGCALVAAAILPGFFQARKAKERAEETNRRIGVPNGEGTVVQMLTDVLHWTGGHDLKDDERFAAIGLEIVAMKGDLATVKERLSVLDTIRNPVAEGNGEHAEK